MVPRPLAGLFTPEVTAITVRDGGWAAKKNGELLQAAQHEFDALVTMDRGLPHQQNMESLDLAVILVRAVSNRLEDLEPLIDQIEDSAGKAEPGTLSIVRMH
jgi:hypothetical protein